MASDTWQLQIDAPKELLDALEITRKELQAAQEALSEDRIRKIIHEELAKFAKQQQHERRFGIPMQAEVK